VRGLGRCARTGRVVATWWVATGETWAKRDPWPSARRNRWTDGQPCFKINVRMFAQTKTNFHSISSIVAQGRVKHGTVLFYMCTDIFTDSRDGWVCGLIW
jgi:hypothetical protein